MNAVNFKRWLCAGLILLVGGCTTCPPVRSNESIETQQLHDVAATTYMIEDLLKVWQNCNTVTDIDVSPIVNTYIGELLLKNGYRVRVKSEQQNGMAYREAYIGYVGNALSIIATLGEKTCTVSRQYNVADNHIAPITGHHIRR